MTIYVKETEAKLRLDKLLSIRFPQYSRQYFQYLIQQNLILVNGLILKKGAKLKEGDEIEIEFIVTPEIRIEPEAIPLEILFEDDHLIAINKPAGMVVHPAVGNWSGTFVHALLYHCKNLVKDQGLRPGIVHRLDKDTSGILIAAKNTYTQQLLVQMFANRQIKKEYLAICIGNPGNRLIKGNIGRHPVKRKEMAVLQEKGREALTDCKSLAYNSFFSLVRLQPQTGRTHQIRVHLKMVGTPILGDPIYGISSINQKNKVYRQMLHAHEIFFTHPIHQKEIHLKAPIPHDMEKFIKLISPSYLSLII
ncbi:MAG: RluA family pseudouridine synthase [Chlamydiales bacterium]